MKQDYAVTIGIPVYKSLCYIEDTMSSALAQTFPDIEFLIVDDCGDDGTIDIIKQFQIGHPRGKDIRIIHNDTNKGVGYSRNRIIDEANGNYLYFMDSDDTIEANTIHLLYQAVCDNSAQIAYGSYEIIDCVNDNSRHIYQKNSLVLSGENELAMYAFKNNHIFHVSVCNHLINLAFLRQTGVRFADVSYWEDMLYTTELVTKVTESVMIPEVTYHYFRRPGSLSNYQVRDKLEKQEIIENISVINCLKEMSKNMLGKPYLPYLCYNLEMNSFYAVCQILRKYKIIVPKIKISEIRAILNHPISIFDVLKFKHKRLANFVFWVVGNLPILLFVPTIWLLGKLKRAI
jgi:glycosyltransferase involved in cell wall biosynthesis